MNSPSRLIRRRTLDPHGHRFTPARSHALRPRLQRARPPAVLQRPSVGQPQEILEPLLSLRLPAATETEILSGKARSLFGR